MTGNGLAHIEGAERIDLKYLSECFGCTIKHAVLIVDTLCIDAGIVHENVNATKSLNNGVNHFNDLIVRRNIAHRTICIRIVTIDFA